MNKDDYALWAQIANAAAEKKIRPELIQVDDEGLQQHLNTYCEKQRKREAANNKLYASLDTDFYFGRPVLGKILILPRSGARQFVYDKPWACISIASERAELPKLNKVQQVAILQETFEDLDGCSAVFEKLFPEKAANLFTTDHANRIWDFVEHWWNDIDLLMVHCYAGASRSPAIGKAISDVYYPELSHYYDMMFQPNKLVYETMRNAQAHRHT